MSRLQHSEEILCTVNQIPPSAILLPRWRTVTDLMGSLQEEAGLVPTVSSYNVVVEAFAKAGEWKKALETLGKMKDTGVRPTEFTYSRCMAGLSTLLVLVPWG